MPEGGPKYKFSRYYSTYCLISYLTFDGAGSGACSAVINDFPCPLAKAREALGGEEFLSECEYSRKEIEAVAPSLRINTFIKKEVEYLVVGCGKTNVDLALAFRGQFPGFTITNSEPNGVLVFQRVS